MTPTNLWDFACRHYARPGVEKLCLSLQEDWQGDVGLLFWLVWLERQGHPLDVDRLRRAQTRITPWQNRVLKPLRQLRRQIKTDYPDPSETTEACRQAIKSAELRAEQRNLEELATLAKDWFGASPKPPLNPGSNLRLYARQLDLPEALHRQLVQCLAGE